MLIGIGGLIGAALGFFATRSLIGAFLGYFIGSSFDKFSSNNTRSSGPYNFRRSSYSNDASYYSSRLTQNDFATALLILSGAVMKADGKVLRSELNYVKSFFQTQFGSRFHANHLQVLKRFLDSNTIPLEQICQDIKFRMQPEVRLQLIHYLFGIAKADGVVSNSEIAQIQRISILLGIPNNMSSLLIVCHSLSLFETKISPLKKFGSGIIMDPSKP